MKTFYILKFCKFNYWITFFSRRVTSYWNHLIAVLVSSKCLNIFRNGLDVFMTVNDDTKIYV